jgi:hemolysin activation/secretion protein
VFVIKARIWILGVVVAAGFAHAQSHADAPTAGTFRISGFAIEGRLLLKSEDFTRVVSAFVGPGKTAADIERARRALQQTYYDLGYCSTTVSLLHPEPRDGVVTFRLTEARAGEIPECLPMVALDGETKRSPATSGSKPAEVATYAYTDLRDSQEPRVKPRGSAGNAAPRQESAAPLAANTAFQKPSTAPQHKSAVDAIAPATAPSDFRAGASSPIAPRIQAPGAAADRGNAEVPSGVSVAPYVEGAGTKGLSLASDAVPIDKGSDANPAATVTQARPVPLAASAAQSGMETKISQVRAGTSSAVPADSSQSAPSAVAQAEPAKPAPAAAAPQVELMKSAPAAAAQPEPAKPSPATVAPQAEPAKSAPVAVAQVEPVKPTSAAAAPQVEPAKSAPAAVVQAEPVKPAPAVAARLAEPVKPTSAAAAPQAEPVKPVPAAVAPQAEPARPAPAAIAQAEPAKPGPAPIAQAGPVVPAPTAPPAEPSAAAPLKFSISRYIVEGNTLLKQEQIDRVLAPYSGSGKDFGDVQRALEALQLAYQKEGYGSVEIRLPEQELEKGEVKLRVVEPKVGRITVEGNEHFSEANIRHGVPD